MTLSRFSRSFIYQKSNKYATHVVVIRNQGNVCTVRVVLHSTGMKKPYTYHFEMELYKDDSELRTQLNFIMSVLRCQDGTTVPCVDERGFFFKDFIFELPDTTNELFNLLRQICAWLNAPENNKYNRLFTVGDVWDITPASGPPKLGTMLTPRDTAAFLTHVFGQENAGGVVELPQNWATENRDTLDIFIDDMSTELARELGVDMNGWNLNLPEEDEANGDPDEEQDEAEDNAENDSHNETGADEDERLPDAEDDVNDNVSVKSEDETQAVFDEDSQPQ